MPGIEADIASYMLKMAKFEFWLINTDRSLGKICEKENLRVVSGVNWQQLAVRVEAAFPFANFDFDSSQFKIFKETVPQLLTLDQRDSLKWDSADVRIETWETLIQRGFAQLRNNIAHGNKAQMSAPYTYDRTEQFLSAGHALIEFISRRVFRAENWEREIGFQ
ncbi:hypothetical protein [Pseudokordiimonas caeni]|uniref:hypothetical protein n=1 Tax=Pseudokordiimonas caeni TaxID=2997908 RepID=UPI002810C85C|nr:hypothetical protein [Pseudokordiimonas caeni]